MGMLCFEKPNVAVKVGRGARKAKLLRIVKEGSTRKKNVRKER